MEYPYLCVDAFLAGPVETRTLVFALDSGLVDLLQEAAPNSVPPQALQTRTGTDSAGLGFLLELLTANNVVRQDKTGVRLTDAFAKALGFRDLLEVKAGFALLLAPDWMEHFPLLLSDPSAFMAQSRVMKLFDYERSLTYSAENYEHTRSWMRLPTTLTRYEAQAVLDALPEMTFDRLLDVGGNSGEFALQFCRRFPHLQAEVADLPLVCQIGREHVSRFPEAERIRFSSLNVLTDPLPGACDLISFKSMLHDWPETEAGFFLGKAAESLRPGGTLLIFERVSGRLSPHHLTFSQIPILLFHRYYRSPEFYRKRLLELGLSDIAIQLVDLETPFALITARKDTE